MDLAQIGRRLGNFEDRADVLFDSEAAKYRGFLRQITDAEPGAPVHRQIGDVTAVEADRPGVGGDQTGDDVKAGGLSRAVGAEQADDFAALHGDVDVAQYRPPLEAFAQTLSEETAVVGDQPRPAPRCSKVGGCLLGPWPVPFAAPAHGFGALPRGAPATGCSGWAAA